MNSSVYDDDTNPFGSILYHPLNQVVPWNHGHKFHQGWDLLIMFLSVSIITNILSLVVAWRVRAREGSWSEKSPVSLMFLYLNVEGLLFNTCCLIQCVGNSIEQQIWEEEAGCTIQAIYATLFMLSYGWTLVLMAYSSDRLVRKNKRLDDTFIRNCHIVIWIVSLTEGFLLSIFPGSWRVMPSGIFCFPQLATPIGTALFYCTGVVPAIVIMAVLYIRMFLFVRAATSVKDRAKETAAAVTAGGGAGSLTLTNGSNLTSESCRTDTSGSMGGSLAASKFDYSSAEPSSATAETGMKGKSSFSNGASASSSSTSFLALFSPLSHNFNLFKRSAGAASAAVHPSAPPPALTDYSAVLLRVTSKRLSARRISSIAIPEPPTSAHRGDVDSAGSADDGAMSDDICDTERSHGGSALSHAGQLCESVTAPQANSQRQKEAAAGAGRASSQSIASDSRDCRSSSSNHTNSNEEEGVSASLLAPPSKGNTGCGSGSSGVVAAAAAGVGTPHTPSTPVDEALALKRKIADDAVKLAAAVYRAAREARRTRRHWQVAKRAMAFFFCFVACWWPFIMITMVEWITGYVPTPAIDLIGAQLGHLNTFFNALLHLYFNASFRNEALRLLASCVAFLGCRSMAERFAPPAKQPHRRASGSSGKSSTPTMNVAVAQRHAARRGSLDGGSGTGGFAAGGHSKKGIHSGSASCTVPPPPEEPKVGSSSISDDAETTSAVSAATETAMTIVKISGGSSSPRSPSTTCAGPSTTTATTTPSPAVRGGGKGGARPTKFRRGSMAPLMDSEPIDTPPTTPTAAASESPSAAALPAHPGSVGASSDINESMGSSRAVVTSVRRTSPRQPPSDDPSPRQSPSHGGNDDLTSPRKSPRLADQLLHSDAGGSARGRSIVVAATSTSAATSSKTIPLYSSTSSTAALST